MNPAPNLFFVGPMGAGKSTLGKRVAETLGLPFFDLDHEIQAQCGADVALIFDIEGECGFRRRESATLAEFVARDGIVLATGGGAILDAGNRGTLHERGFVVFLETTVDEQLERLARDRKRPLLAAPDRRERLQQLAAARDPLYREIADLVIPAGHRGSTTQVAEHITTQLTQTWRRLPEGRAA